VRVRRNDSNGEKFFGFSCVSKFIQGDDYSSDQNCPQIAKGGKI
jgi:hypothetical protein